MKKKPKLPFQVTTKNSRILHDTMVTLGALKEGTRLEEMPINEIQVHLLDKDGDGIILCLEYDELTGELEKTFHNTPEEDDLEVASTNTPHYYGEDHNELDPCISPENIKKRFEEVVSEEYEEALSDIFHNGNNDDDEPPPLLN